MCVLVETNVADIGGVRTLVCTQIQDSKKNNLKNACQFHRHSMSDRKKQDYIYVYTHACISAQISMYIIEYVYIYIYICIGIYTYIYIYYIYIHIYTHIYIHKHMYIYKYTKERTNIYIYTYKGKNKYKSLHMSARRNLLLLEQDMTRLGGPVWVVKAPSKVHGLLRLSSDNLVRSSCKCKYIYIYLVVS